MGPQNSPKGVKKKVPFEEKAALYSSLQKIWHENNGDFHPDQPQRDIHHSHLGNGQGAGGPGGSTVKKWGLAGLEKLPAVC
jgi:hypothetical protein